MEAEPSTNLQVNSNSTNDEIVSPDTEPQPGGNKPLTRTKSHGNCNVHPTETCRMHCEDCDCLVCEECIIGPHKQHCFNKIANIQIEAKKQELIKCVSKTRDEKLTTLKEVLEDIRENQLDYIKQVDITLQQMKDKVDSLKAEIDRIHENMVQELKQKAKDDIDNLKKKRSELEAKVADLKKSVKECELKTNKLDRKGSSVTLNFVMDTKQKLTNYEMYPEHVPINPPIFTSCEIDIDSLKSMMGSLGAGQEGEAGLTNGEGMDENTTPSTDKDKIASQGINGTNNDIEPSNTDQIKPNSFNENPDKTTNNVTEKSTQNENEEDHILDELFNNSYSTERRIPRSTERIRNVPQDKVHQLPNRGNNDRRSSNSSVTESINKTATSQKQGMKKNLPTSSNNSYHGFQPNNKKNVTWNEQTMEVPESETEQSDRNAQYEKTITVSHSNLNFEILTCIDTTRTFGSVASKCLSPLSNEQVWVGNGCKKEIGLISDEGEYLECIKTDFMFETISVTQSGELLVADFDNCMLKKVTKSEEFENLADLSPFQVNCMCVTNMDEILCGLTHINKNDEKTAKVVRLTSKGQTMKTYEFYEDGSPLFIEPYSITQNSNQDVWVAEDNMDESSPIKIIDRQGKYKFKYSGPQGVEMDRGFYPYCIVCENNNRILVSDCKNNSIQLVDANGQFLQFLMTAEHGLSHPTTLAKDNEENFWIQCSNNKIYIVYYDDQISQDSEL